MSSRARVRSLVFLTALVASWCTTPATAAGPGPCRPFRGGASGMVVGQMPSGGLVLEFTGTATHLGRFTRTEFLDLAPDGSVSGTIIFVAANGDELWLEFTGGFTSPTTAEGTYSFTGGTGRFREATGEATFLAYTPDGFNAEVTFEGTICY